MECLQGAIVGATVAPTMLQSLVWTASEALFSCGAAADDEERRATIDHHCDDDDGDEQCWSSLVCVDEISKDSPTDRPTDR